MGTWIEICCNYQSVKIGFVVPYVGTWIEMQKQTSNDEVIESRSLRGNVDRNDQVP